MEIRDRTPVRSTFTKLSMTVRSIVLISWLSVLFLFSTPSKLLLKMEDSFGAVFTLLFRGHSMLITFLQVIVLYSNIAVVNNYTLVPHSVLILRIFIKPLHSEDRLIRGRYHSNTLFEWEAF